MAGFVQRFDRLVANVSRVMHGKDQVVRAAISCVLAEGHLLIEDVPGVGKTSLARAIAASVALTWNRIQFTPDLLPSDVTGVSVFDQATSTFSFRPGPVFANIVLGDEINRASPKTQSALLEVMQEQTVTTDATVYRVPRPFVVVATQNPIDLEGTYVLPEAQLDRFLMRIEIGYPGPEAEAQVLRTEKDEATVTHLSPGHDRRRAARDGRLRQADRRGGPRHRELHRRHLRPHPRPARGPSRRLAPRRVWPLLRAARVAAAADAAAPTSPPTTSRPWPRPPWPTGSSCAPTPRSRAAPRQDVIARALQAVPVPAHPAALSQCTRSGNRRLPVTRFGVGAAAVGGARAVGWRPGGRRWSSSAPGCRPARGRIGAPRAAPAPPGPRPGRRAAPGGEGPAGHRRGPRDQPVAAHAGAARRSSNGSATRPSGPCCPACADGEQGLRTYRLPTSQRGVYDIGPVEIPRADPFGLCRTVQRMGEPQRIAVHPRLLAMHPLPTGISRNLEGPSSDTSPQGTVTFHRLREYVVGDDLRTVHWPSTAHAGKLVVRHNVDTAQPYTVVLPRPRLRTVLGRDVRGGDRRDRLAGHVHGGRQGPGAAAADRTATGSVGPSHRDPTPLVDYLTEVAPDPRARSTAELVLLRRDRGGTALVVVTGRLDLDTLPMIAALRRRFDRVMASSMVTAPRGCLPVTRG